jgi:hypothetical protein
VLASGVAGAAALLEAVFELAVGSLSQELFGGGFWGFCGRRQIFRIYDQILAVENRLPFVATADPDAGRTDRAETFIDLPSGSLHVPSQLVL